MQVVDLINNAVTKTGLAPLDAVPTNLYNFAFNTLNRIFEDVWNMYPFRDEKIVGVSCSLTADEDELVLPQDVEAVRAVRTASDPIYPINELILDNFAPGVFDDTGSPTNFYNLADSPVLAQPAAAGTITVVSSSASDVHVAATPLVVRIYGTVSDVMTYENFNLNGTTNVTGSLSFSEISQISKPITVGRITVSRASTELGTIPSWAYQGQYRRIRIYPIPDDTYTVYVDGLRRFPRLTSDYDTILLRKCESAIFSMLCAELFEYKGDMEAAIAERGKAKDQFGIAIVKEEHLEVNDNAIYPNAGMFGDGFWPVDTSNTGTGRWT
ncbi:MAG: hypothetical protein KJ899_15500 [Gammaproteobacteria bacterium]|nr:hypothetical protein [Gammaproteobacteria bacterium]